MKMPNSYLKMFCRRQWFYLLLVLIGLSLLIWPKGFSQEDLGSSTVDLVYTLELNDEIISPVTAEYMMQGIEEAHANKARAVLIKLDTPGGLLSSTHTIVKALMNAPLPVMVYVSPAGARAGSAGVFITLASHVAVMEPSTHIGAAHPVDAGGTWPTGGEEDSDKAPGRDSREVMSEKIMNDTIAQIRVIAKARNRNEEWAVRAVTESDSITAEEAVKANVVDFLAPDVESLLQQAHGREVTVNNQPVTLDLDNPRLVDYEFSWRQQILSVLTHPVLAYFLLMIGFYGILFEVTNPGLGFSGFIGVVCLILALIGMQTLSINFAGLGLVVLGLILFVVEVFTPTFGILLGAGVLCLLLGSLLIYQTNEPFLEHLVPSILGIAASVALVTGFLVKKVFKAYKPKAEDPIQKLLQETGRVVQEIQPGQRGKVKVFGETWDAESDTLLSLNTRIRVVGFSEAHDRVLKVESIES